MVDFDTLALIYGYVVTATIAAATLLQLFNILVLVIGMYKKVLDDPIYFFWMGYGIADIAIIAIDFGFYTLIWGYTFVPMSFVFKWASFFEGAFGWYPGIMYQLALAVYCLVVSRYPLRYHSLLGKPKAKMAMAMVAVAIMAFAVIISIPLALPGYDVCICPEGGKSTPQMEALHPYYDAFHVVVFGGTFFAYLFVVLKFKKDDKDVDPATKKTIRRLTATAFISWGITVFHKLAWSLSFIRVESWQLQVAIRWVMYSSYQLNYLASPVVQLVRNSAYRKFALKMAGLNRFNKVKPSTVMGTHTGN